MADFALYHNGKQVSKAHSTREAVEIEAYKRRLAVSCQCCHMNVLTSGNEIREIADG